MTRITKLVMNKFKSFARKTEVVLGPDFNCVLGPNGSGKCVIGDTLVHLANGSLCKISEIVNEKIKSNPVKKIDDGLIAYGDKTEILSLDLKSLKITRRQIQAYVKRQSPEQLLKIKTKSGKQITATEYHPLFVLSGGEVKSIKSEDLDVGVRIAVPRKLTLNNNSTFFELIDFIQERDNIYIPWKEDFVCILKQIKYKTWNKTAKLAGVPYNVIKGVLDKQAVNFAHLIKIFRFANKSNEEIIGLITQIKAKNSSKLYNMIWHNSQEFSRLLGYLLAEGRLSDSNQIWFTNGSEEVVKDYVKLVKTCFGVDPSIKEYKPNCWDVLVYSVPLIKILSRFGMKGGARKKEISDLFMKHSSDKEASELLNGLFCGDGYVSKNHIDIVTKSINLAFGIQVLLSRLGIISHTKDIIKIATNTKFSGVYKQVSIYGVQNFYKFSIHIKLVHKKKHDRVQVLLGKTPNPNIDLLEANDIVKKVTKDIGIKIKSNKEDFPKLDAYCYNRCLPSRTGIKQLVNELFIPSSNGQFAKSLMALKTLSHSDILWDEIVSIEKTKPKEKWVYDLCVEKDHNFIANNIIVHNSNVVDAMCFVLGKLSAKGLRAEKSANLIYNGGKKGKPAKEAEVSIYFDNLKKEFPIKGKEVKISRIVKKTGQSLYKINDETRTRQQVLELLSAAQIDPDGHNIVLQGDIVHFMDMRPIERREMIDEVAGISIFEEKKDKAMNELSKVQDRLNEADIILTEREKTLKDLKKDRDQALRFKDLEKNIKRNKATRLHLMLKVKQERYSALESNSKKFEKNIDTIQKVIQQLKDDIEKKKKEVSGINKELEEHGDKKQRELSKEIESIKIELTDKSVRKDVVENEIKKIKERKRQLQKSILETKNEISSLEKKKLSVRNKNQKNSAREEQLRHKIEAHKKAHGLEDAQGMNDEISELEYSIEENQKKVQDLIESKQELIRQKDRKTFELESVQGKLGEAQDAKEGIQDKRIELKNFKSEFKQVTKELSKALNESSVFSAQLGNARNKLMDATDELAKLRARNIGIREMTAGNRATQKIKSLKIPGVYGTVSELGNVNSKYALALEVAAGGRIKSMVVSSDAVAAKCINILKESKSGVMTFLPLNKLKERMIKPEARKLASSSGAYGLALDLVTYDSKFKSVFKYVFASTIVVENLATARRLGVGRERMVTLDGDLIESSGAMVGGHRRKTGMGFQEKELSKGMEKVEEEIASLNEKVSLIEKRKTENEEAIIGLRERKAVLEAKIRTLEQEVPDSVLTSELRVEKKDLVGLITRLQKEIKQKDIDIKVTQNELGKQKQERERLRGKISKLSSSEVADKLEQLEKERQGLREEIIKNDSLIQNIASQIIMQGEEIEKVEKIMSDNLKELDEFSKEQDIVTALILQNKKILKEKGSEQKKFYANYQHMFTRKNRLNNLIQQQDIRVIKQEERVRGVESKRNELTVKMAVLAGEMEGLKKEFEEFKGVSLRKGIKLEGLNAEIRNFEQSLRNMGNVNLRALEIYENVHVEYKKLLDKYEKLKLEKEDVLKMMFEIESKKKVMFMKTYKVLARNFSEIFASLSTKGEAVLILENMEDPFDGGVDIAVKIAQNKSLDIKSLSGGEKTLAALSFIFAIQEFNPAPFYLMDEVDAALDKRNSELLSRLIAKYAKGAQYLIISHNDSIISEADTIYGISMQEGVTKVTSLRI